MKRLHAIRKDIKTTLWCGPAALATISDRPVSEVMHVVRKVTGKESPKGVCYIHLERAALALGYKLESIPVQWHNLSTVARWTADNRSTLRETPVIICISNHYITVSGRLFNDNSTCTPIPLKKAPYRRSRVRAAWRVVPVTTPVAPIVVPPPAPKDPQRNVREHAKNLAREFGLEITVGDPSPDCIWVGPPPQGMENDPHEGDHYVYDWSSALDRVMDYARALTAPVDVGNYEI